MGHDPDREPSEPTFDDDVRIAYAALGEGDLEHARHHVAGAVASGADRPECARLIDAWAAAAAPDPLAHVPAKDLWYGLAALRAELLARAGRRRDAVPLLLACLAAVPHAPFVPWLDGWLDAATCSAVDPDAVARELVQCTRHEPLGAALCQLARRLHVAHATHDLLAFATVKLNRMCWRMDEAVEIARAATARAPMPMTTIALAGTYREMGDLEQCYATFEEAARLDPSNTGVMLDLGDIALTLGRLDDSLAAYQRALAAEPGNDWAEPSVIYVRWKLSRADADADALRAYLDDHPDNRRARDLLVEIDGGD